MNLNTRKLPGSQKCVVDGRSVVLGCRAELTRESCAFKGVGSTNADWATREKNDLHDRKKQGENAGGFEPDTKLGLGGGIQDQKTRQKRRQNKKREGKKLWARVTVQNRWVRRHRRKKECGEIT